MSGWPDYAQRSKQRSLDLALGFRPDADVSECVVRVSGESAAPDRAHDDSFARAAAALHLALMPRPLMPLPEATLLRLRVTAEALQGPDS